MVTQLNLIENFGILCPPSSLGLLQKSTKHTILFEVNIAYIILIPKPNKDFIQCAIYRPISLINVDIKIISKALSARLGTVITTLIHNDILPKVQDG